MSFRQPPWSCRGGSSWREGTPVTEDGLACVPSLTTATCHPDLNQHQNQATRLTVGLNIITSIDTREDRCTAETSHHSDGRWIEMAGQLSVEANTTLCESTVTDITPPTGEVVCENVSHALLRVSRHLSMEQGKRHHSSYSSAVFDSEKEQQISSSSSLWSAIMSRRSLRLVESRLDRSLPHSSASIGVGGGSSWRSSRSLRSWHSQEHSVSCSELPLKMPCKKASPLLHNDSLHSVASDATLISSLMDKSSIQESTVLDALWGLDHDCNPQESTIIEVQSSMVVNGTPMSCDVCCAEQPDQMVSSFDCKNCSSSQGNTKINLHQEQKKDAFSTLSSASKYTSSPALTGLPESGEPETTTIYCRDRSRRSGTARSNHCGVMSLKESATHGKKLHPNGALCDDCKEKQHSDTGVIDSSSWSSLASSLLGLSWSAVIFAAFGLWALTQSAAAVLYPLTKKAVSASWSAARSAGQTAGDGFKRLHKRWHHMTSRVCQSRFPLRLSLLLLALLLLLLLSLSWFNPAIVQLVLPGVNVTEWRTSVFDVPASSSIDRLSEEVKLSTDGAVEEWREPEPALAETASGEEELSADDSERVTHLERSLKVLWERVEAGGRRAEQRHREVLRLYSALQQQQLASAPQRGGEEVELWVSSMMDQHLSELQNQLDEERREREELRQQDLLHQKSHMSRLDQLELQLRKLVDKTQMDRGIMDVYWRQEAALLSPSTLPVSVSADVDRQSHDALLAEVTRLESAVEEMRHDIVGLSQCQNTCQQLTRIQQMISGQVSAQVQEEVRALVYGNQLTQSSDATTTLPESVLQWLLEQYVSKTDLQAALSSLELHILSNISLQLGQQQGEQVVRDSVLHTTKAAGVTVTEEDVRVIVKNALQRFSEDRTGLADYALESGGGSILSTRCSETYETKAALLSLFGIPLWYFSQSPRAVIQPDVHPGNCWAFRGSKGFLVIHLSMRILPTAFTLEHIPRALAPSRTLRSAPRDFSVYGLDDEGQERGKLLGNYTYDQDGESLQTYPVTEENDEAFQIIEVQILSNWGHLEYTCMYRFRVHGTPSDTSP
ncbi:uncharacterized protein KZ484_013520 [Pholidichthys leucotaenia]